MSNYKEGDDIENLLYGTTYELLAEVLTLYNSLFPIKEHEKLRWEKLKVETGMDDK